MAKRATPAIGNANLDLKFGNALTPERAAQLVTKVTSIPCSRKTILRRAQEDKIKAYRLHARGHIWIDRDSLMKYIQECMEAPAAENVD